MERSDVEPEVWCRRDGPVRARYEALGITCRIVPGMPKMTTLKLLSRNIYGYTVFLREFKQWHQHRTELLRAIIDRFDLIHFNHENLYFLADWLRRRHDKPQTMHMRTLIWNNVFGRRQSQSILKSINRLIFITENERENFMRLANVNEIGTVIYNIASGIGHSVLPHSSIPRDARLKIAVLSNYSFMRGIDRVVEVAEVLASRGKRDVLFVVAGNMHLPRSLPGALGRIARSGGTLVDYASSRGVDDMILFLGHVPHPESILSACDFLIKPTRQNNPWGRDILEGLSAGKPIISIGHYNRFIESEVTGFLLEEYDSGRIADLILRLDANRALCWTLGQNGAKRVGQLCDGPSRARDLLEVWRDAVLPRHGSAATTAT